MKKKIIIACSKKWFFSNKNSQKLIKRKNVVIFKEKKQLNKKNLDRIKPSAIFFPHWSYKVSSEITDKYNCIGFHTAPLPFGRGGSPIQNLILKRFKNAPVCALKMNSNLDDGPIYLKKNINLSGNLSDIFNKISVKIIQMIEVLMKKKIVPKKQRGKVFYFKRLRNNSEIRYEKNLNSVFDKIRMLDAEEYKNSYIVKNKLKIVLTKANKKKNYISCNAKIFKIK